MRFQRDIEPAGHRAETMVAVSGTDAPAPTVVTKQDPVEPEWTTPPLADPQVNETLVLEPAVGLPRPSSLDQTLPAHSAPIHPPVAAQMQLDATVPGTATITETPELPEVPGGTVRVEPQVSAATEPSAPIMPPVSMPPLARQATESLPDVAGIFPPATELISGLQELVADPVCRDWARDLVFSLEMLPQMKSPSGNRTAALFNQMFHRLAETPQFVERTKSPEVRAKILRLGYAAKRRADVWFQVARILSSRGSSTTAIDTDMPQRLQAVVERIGQADYGQAWRQYLLLDEVGAVVGSGDPQRRSDVARRALKRMESVDLSRTQVEVLGKSPFREFRLALIRWANEPIDYLRLLDQIEVYERTGSTESSREIADCYNVVRWSAQPEVRKLADLLNTHYRNANVRVALTAEFLNRLLPEPQSYEQSVNSNIAGANVYGTSRTVNRLKVVLHPDSETWRIGLEAHGEVASDTAASKGPATFYNQGFARYYARKLLQVDRVGIRVGRAETDADSETALTGFETDFDPIPVVGWLARAVARNQHDQHSYSAKVETNQMVRNEAGNRFDDEVHQRLEAAEEKVKKKLIEPFEKINLHPTALDMSTTEQRVIARYRLAADGQLGAQTPRPQAPGDSLLSVQIHQSALNNTLANLRLEKRRVELRTLYQEMAVVFERPDLVVPDDIPEGVVIRFAEDEAVRVQCDQSRVVLTIRIAELKSGRSKYENFSVRAHYLPDSSQLNANLVRDETLEIIGEHLRINERVPLRFIFSKVLSRSRPFNLINQHLAENPHLGDCHVNQFVIHDGWIGVGIGPADLNQLAKKKSPPAR